MNQYPSKEDVEDHSNSLLPLLGLFMKELIADEITQSFLGQPS